jgi:hypothetical protein
MNEALQLLGERGLDVTQVKIVVRCRVCHHEWQLRLLPEEFESPNPNPNWGSCWICRLGGKELNQMGHDGVDLD